MLEDEPRFLLERRQVRVDEAAGRWRAARWHLDRLVAADPQAGPLYLRRGKAALAARDAAVARRDFDKAVTLLPAEWEPWFQRGRQAIREACWQEAIDDLDKALERKQKKEGELHGPVPSGIAAILHLRATARASLGQWKEADADLKRVVKNPFEQIGPAPRVDYALILLKLGDSHGYSATCQGMLAQFANTKDEPRGTIVTTEYGSRDLYNFGKPFDPNEATAIVWICCLNPDSLPDFSRLRELARRAASLDKQSYPFARAYGAALFRARDYETAVKQLETAGALQKGSSPSVWLFLAMAHQRRGQTDEAKEWLGKARAWIEQARKRKPDAGPAKSGTAWEYLPWNERLVLELLQAEAEKLILSRTTQP
jgi:tetratricopeptide (TPR) repeat protein